jgi:hypothetical protein
MSRASPSRIPIRPMVSDALEQLVEIEGGASAEVIVVSAQECLAGAAPLVAQYGLPLAEVCPRPASSRASDSASCRSQLGIGKASLAWSEPSN